MRPLRLYIDNFMCFDTAYIDFTQFSSALIVGNIGGNSSYSNGVGKTSIFKAIEYVLFNQADVNLENIVRDESAACRIVMDFLIGEQEYRLSRSRTKKGNTDLTLLQRNSQEGTEEEVYHQINHTSNAYPRFRPHIDRKETEIYWKDKSGSRAGDTEKDLDKLIKFNSKSFRSTIHFMQNDATGLATARPEKRKAILKEALNLSIYTKLEKIVKEKATRLQKEIEKQHTIIEGLGNPTNDLQTLATQLSTIETTLSNKQEEANLLDTKIQLHQEQINQLTIKHSALESKFASLIQQEISLTKEQTKTQSSIQEYTAKRSDIIKLTKSLIAEIKSLKEEQAKLQTLNYDDLSTLSQQIDTIKEQVAQHNATIKASIATYEDLKIPLPSGSVCKACRKPMSDNERQTCQQHIDQEMKDLQHLIQSSKQAIITLNKELAQHQHNINSLNASKQQLDTITAKITNKEKEYQDKSTLYQEYHKLLEEYKVELEDKKQKLLIVQQDLQTSSLEEANSIKQEISAEKEKINQLTKQAAPLRKEITHHHNGRAIIQNNIQQRTQDQEKKLTLTASLQEMETKHSQYPSVIQSFSSSGIPNLIVQDVLDDLQIEANNLLNLLKPGLQLTFLVEKTKGDGEQADTLDIKYHVNGKERYYEQLSGAMRLAVAFSLKLGLSSILQNRLGIDIKFLLLDEIDQSLDKAGVDALADIVKLFQQDFKILVITHNDRLKDKFKSIILVEQDLNMVSRAQVISS